MNRPIDWGSFVGPLDVFKLYLSPHCVRKWSSYKRIPNGIEFRCELDEWPDELMKHRDEGVIIRVEFVQDEVIRFRQGLIALPDHFTEMLIKEDWSPVENWVEEMDDRIVLESRKLRVEIQRYPWQMRVYPSAEQQPFFRQRVDDRAYGPAYEAAPIGFDISDDGRITVRETVEVTPGESFYGLGEHFTPINKWGQEIKFWAVDSGNVSSFRAYKNIPFFMSSEGYGIFINSSYPMVFRMGTESAISYSFHVMEEQLDYFIIHGPEYKDILKNYCDLTGFAPVPPKWSFGFWISRCGYKNRGEVEDVVSDMRQHGFPCDVISIDPWWMGDGSWTTFEWDKKQFPDPPNMIKKLREKGVRTCLWIHPYLPVSSSTFQEADKKGFLVKKPGGTEYARVMESFSGNDIAAIDFTNPDAVAWFQSRLQKLVDDGVSTFKTDFGEQAPIEAVYHNGRTGLEMHNLYPLLYNRAAFELTRRNYGRGLVWGRSAYAGSQCYPVQWGGDSYASFDQMASQLRGLLSYSMSGVPFCSHDIGGFDYPPAAFDHQKTDFSTASIHIEDYSKDPELYIRWMQFGVFSSHTRAHGKQPREPWTYGKAAEEITKKFLKLRYRLLPYIYSEAVECTKSGLPMVRPLLLEYPADMNTRNLDLEYMFGSKLLVAPVVTRKNQRKVYLPEGKWIDFWTKALCEGGRWIDVDVPLEKIPLWIKEGTILPYGPEMDWVGQKPLDPLTIEFFYPADQGEYVIHDEDMPDIPVRYSRNADKIDIFVGKATGIVEIKCYGVDMVGARLNGSDIPVEDVNGYPLIQFTCLQPSSVSLSTKL